MASTNCPTTWESDGSLLLLRTENWRKDLVGSTAAIETTVVPEPLLETVPFWIPLSRASVAVGAHGLIVEVHHKPDEALSDGAQSLYPEQFEALSKWAGSVHKLLKT